MIIHKYTSTAETEEEATKALEEILREKKDKEVLLLCSGGSAFKILDRISKDVLGTHVTLGVLDERYSTDPQVNNFLQLRETNFYKKSYACGVNFIESIPHAGESLSEFGVRLESVWRVWKTKYPHGEIVITQGMGPDGHTAGMMPYPEDPTFFVEHFENTERWVSVYDAASKNKFRERATATAVFLKEMVDISLVYLVGADKQEKFDKFMSKDEMSLAELPIQILKEMKEVRIFTDLR